MTDARIRRLGRAFLRRVKFSKLEGSVAAGDCPESAITFDGVDAGTWGPNSSDEGLGMGYEYRVYGYSATIDTHPVTGVYINGDVNHLSVERVGTRHRGGLLNRTSTSGCTESCAAAKARLRRLVAARLAELAAEPSTTEA